jgi:hypothetical protein
MNFSCIPEELRRQPRWVGFRPKGDGWEPVSRDGKRAYILDPATWGTHEQAVSARAERGHMNGTAARPRKPQRARRSKVKPQQRPALLVGGVGAFVLLLSVWECCSGLHALTGMPYALASLLAVGIDLGMVTTEMAAVVSPKGTDAHWWAERYIWLAVGLSVVLNAAAAASHAEGCLKAVAVAVGGVVPVLVYVAGRVAGGLWTGK